MAKLGKRAFSCVAGFAMVMQTDAAVRAKINRSVFQINRALATRTHAF
jgi:hypothetical protein